MAEDVLTLLVTARDNASATLARVSRETKMLGPSAAVAAGPMQKLSAVTGGLVSPLTLALGGVAALSVGMASAVENARKDEQSQRLLGAALEANIPHWDGNTEAIERIIDSRLKLGFTDEAQRESLRQLVAQTKDQTVALDLQRTAMDLARLRNIDLTTASTLLGKVYGGNIGILARYGIQLDKGTTSTEAIAEITKRAAGQAEAWSEGLEGQSAALGIALDEASEKIGYMVTGPLTELVGFLNDDVVPALNFVIDHLKDLKPVVDVLGNAFHALTAPIALAGDIIHLVSGQASEDATSMSEDWGFAWKRMGEDMKAGYTNAQQVAAGNAQLMVETVTEGADKSAEEAGKTPKKMADALLENQFHFQDAVTELRDFMEEALSPRAERMRAKAFLGSKALADGLNSGKPIVRLKAEELKAEAEAVLNRSNARDAGNNLAKTYAEGIDGGAWNALQAAARMAAGVAGFLEFSGSPPYTKSRKMGAEVARTYGEALTRGIARINPSMPNLSAGITGRGGFGSGGGPTFVFHSTFPPTRSQAAEIVRSLWPELQRESRRQRAN